MMGTRVSPESPEIWLPSSMLRGPCFACAANASVESRCCPPLRRESPAAVL